MATPRIHTLWRNASVAAACALLALIAFAQGRVTSTADTDPKLTTVLADLAGSVPQDQGAALEERAGVGRALSADELPQSVHDAMQGHYLRMNARNEVQVYILVDDVNGDNLQQLKALGVTIEISSPARRRVQARIPVSRLRAVAALPFVNLVRPPTYAVHRVGSVTTEGDAILRAANARQQYSLDGTGIKVGVISDGLKGIFATGCTTCSGVANGPIAKGDLPSATGTRSSSGVLTASSGGIAGRSFQANSDLEGAIPGGCPGFAGAGAEGTALLEVVHDIAPGAQLAFSNVDTDLAFEQAVNYLASTNDVVMDDLGFYGEATDGTSPVSTNTANALNNGSNRIRTYVTANGNAADEHYIGNWTDSGVDGTSLISTPPLPPGHLHRFSGEGDTVDVLNRGPQPYNLISMPRNGEVVIFLAWNDPFGGSGNNYDLFLVRDSNNTVVARSTTVQNGTQDPMEFIDYVDNVTTSGTTEYFRIVIQNVNGGAQPRQLNLFSYEPECAVDGPRLLAPPRHERHSYNTANRSVAAQNDSGGSPVSVISVGAICSASAAARALFAGSLAPDESCNDPSNSTIEFFSSQGPTLDGRQKPDVSAIDGVSITGAGSFGNVFFGTSAATPHVAGIAALLLQAAPCLVSGNSAATDPVTARTGLRDLIVANAVPLVGTPNNVFGSGRVDALNSVQATAPVFSGSGTVTVAGNTPTGAGVTGTQLGFTSGAQCMSVSATSGCSGSGATINCPFGTSTTTVSASNNALVGSAQHAVQVTVTSFSVAAAPATATVAAGQSATYQVTVSPQFGAFPSPVTLGCSNLPALSSCSFSPATVTPGAGPAQATVTISTTAGPGLQAATGPSDLRTFGLPRRSRIAAKAGPSDKTAAMLVLFALGAAVTMTYWRRTVGRRNRVAMAGRSFFARHAHAAAWPLAALILALVIGQAACGSSPPSSAAAVSLSPTSLSFGSHGVQTTSAAQTVTLTNTGNAALSISSIAATGDFLQTNTCGTSVAAGGNCSIAISFRPTAAGQRTGTVSITDNASGSPHTVSLSGTGQAGTPAGTYQVGITGSVGTLVQTGNVTLVVQ